MGPQSAPQLASHCPPLPKFPPPLPTGFQALPNWLLKGSANSLIPQLGPSSYVHKGKEIRGYFVHFLKLTRYTTKPQVSSLFVWLFQLSGLRYGVYRSSLYDTNHLIIVKTCLMTQFEVMFYKCSVFENNVYSAVLRCSNLRMSISSILLIEWLESYMYN